MLLGMKVDAAARQARIGHGASQPLGAPVAPSLSLETLRDAAEIPLDSFSIVCCVISRAEPSISRENLAVGTLAAQFPGATGYSL